MDMERKVFIENGLIKVSVENIPNEVIVVVENLDKPRFTEIKEDDLDLKIKVANERYFNKD